MPTWGANKKRDMARSILPSTKKGGQKDRRRIHKRVRASSRSEMLEDPEEADFSSGELLRNHETRGFVDERRLKDKTGPFMRWAERSTLEIRQEDRLSHIRALVPEGLIGEHAVSHVEWKDHFEDPVVSALKKERFANNANYYTKEDERADFSHGIRKLLNTPKGHSQINHALKKSHVVSVLYYADGTQKQIGPEYARTLKGIHDVDSFLEDLYRASRGEMKLSREALDPKFHARVQYGKDAGAFWIPSESSHPEWLEALRNFLTTNKVSRRAS